ncbi:DUF2945 domain-containing protein [Actinokineospora auranticolor]|nr:DUF2945 domain-containing protein [Actinokineospora auranticolor]
MPKFRKGTRVMWKWGTHWAEAVVVSSHDEPVRRMLKGSLITRNGTADNPAYVLEQDNGTHVLKLHSELSKA